MADAAKDTDQSMEEILQSIKRIIAEEGDPVPQDNADVLELTDMLAEDGAVRTPEKYSGAAVESISIEEIMAAPISTPEPSAPVEVFAAAPEPVPVSELPPEAPVSFAVSEEVMEEPVVEEPAPVVAEPAPAPVPAMEDSLLSETTLAAAAAALHALDEANKPAVVPLPHYVGFRSGTTVEDLMMESLKPLIKDWLDSNLPSIVERLVAKEIQKLGNR